MQTEPRNRKKLSPTRLAEKLLTIRRALGTTQTKMLLIINPIEQSGNNRARVSQYELSERVPSLVEVQNYADAVKIGVEMLTNDNLDLPLSIRRKAKLNQKKREEKKTAGGGSGNTNKSIGKRMEKRRGAVYYAAAVPLAAAVHTEADSTLESDSQSASASQSATAGSLQTASRQNNELQEIKNDNGGGSGQESSPAAERIASPVSDIASASSTAPINSTLWTEEAERICKPIYLNRLGDLPLGQMPRLSTGKFVELAMSVIADDFRAHGTESAIARRVRLFIESSD